MNDTAHKMRVQPRPLIAVAIGLGYAAIFAGLFLLSGVSYPELAASTENVFKAVTISMLIMAVLTAGVTTYLGWWPLALRDRNPVTGSKALKALPVIFIIAWLTTLNPAVILEESIAYVLLVLFSTLLVGFNEELVYRGLVVVGARGDGSVREVWVWLTSAILFSLLHAWNFLLGQDLVATLGQLLFTFVLGSMFYAIRRLGVSIVVLMVLHGFWDWSVFVGSGEELDHIVNGAPLSVITPLLLLTMVVLFLVAAKKMFSGKAETPDPTPVA